MIFSLHAHQYFPQIYHTCDSLALQLVTVPESFSYESGAGHWGRLNKVCSFRDFILLLEAFLNFHKWLPRPPALPQRSQPPATSTAPAPQRPRRQNQSRRSVRAHCCRATKSQTKYFTQQLPHVTLCLGLSCHCHKESHLAGEV